MSKYLIIRFSSIGDIIQCMSVVSGIKEFDPQSEIHWITRKDMASILAIDKRIDHIWAFDKKEGLKGLLAMADELKREHFDYIYDAHSNIRSNILKLKLRSCFGGKPRIALRSKDRWKRFLLFKLGINRFPWPFRGMKSFQKPLGKWGIKSFNNNYNGWQFPQEYKDKFKSVIDSKTITIVPSANWEMKRWPVGHWRALIEAMPDYRFIILAGPKDNFCEDICAAAPERVNNLAGKTSLLESCYLVSQSHLVVSADTGFLHAADLFHIPAIAMIGPTAFGYPTGEHIKILEIPLPCRPCTKDGHGKCKQSVYQRCMVEITPQTVARIALKLLSANS